MNFKNTFFTEDLQATKSECRIEEQLKYNNGREKSSDLFKYVLEATHKQSSKNDLLSKTLKKVAETLVVKKSKPTFYI